MRQLTQVYMNEYAHVKGEIRTKLCFMGEETMKLAKTMKEKRKAKGISQSMLADRVGIHVRSIQNYEAGKREPNLETLSKICLELDIPLQRLVSVDIKHSETPPKNEARQTQYEIKNLIQNVSALFSGGELEEEDKDAVMEAIMEAYWIAKKTNKGAAKRSEDENGHDA